MLDLSLEYVIDGQLRFNYRSVLEFRIMTANDGRSFA